jgi:hypothetical protein
LFGVWMVFGRKKCAPAMFSDGVKCDTTLIRESGRRREAISVSVITKPYSTYVERFYARELCGLYDASLLVE